MTLELKPKSGELVVKEGRKRRLAYTPEFKELLVPKEHVFKKFNKLRTGLKNKGEKRDGGDMELELLGHAFATDYYKLKINDKSFFVKVTGKTNEASGGGFREIVSMKKARRILEKEGIDWAEVVSYKLGYDDGKNKYFVSEWRDCLQKNLMQYLERLGENFRSPTPEESTENWLSEFERYRFALEDKYRKLKKVLSGQFHDVLAYNMSYDPESKKIYIFDLKDKQVKA